jgi:hypothetical protein
MNIEKQYNELMNRINLLNRFIPVTSGPDLGLVKRMKAELEVEVEALATLICISQVGCALRLTPDAGSDHDVDKQVDTALKPQFTPNIYQAGINQHLQTDHNYSLIESLNMISSSEDDVAKWSREGRSTHWCATQLHIQYNTK